MMLVCDEMCKCKDEKNGGINGRVGKSKCISKGVESKRVKK